MNTKCLRVFILIQILLFLRGAEDFCLSQELSRSEFRAQLDASLSGQNISLMAELLRQQQTEGMLFIEALLDSYVVQMSENRNML